MNYITAYIITVYSHGMLQIGHNRHTASSSNPDLTAGFETWESYFLFFFFYVDFLRYEVID